MQGIHRDRPAPTLSRTALGALLAALGGCMVGPRYQAPPALDLGSGWIEPGPVEAGAAVVELEQWWLALDDPALTALIDEALRQNLALREAATRVLEARAAVDVSQSRTRPTLDARASVTARRQSENGPLPIGQIPNLERDQTIYDMGLDTAWELDLFGRTRRAIESAGARFDASRDDEAAMRIAVAAEVGRSYFLLRGAQQAIAARRGEVAALARTLELTRQRVAAGDVAADAVEPLRLQLALAESARSPLEAQQRAATLALSLLVGAAPERALELESATPAAMRFAALPIGQRADLLRRRPDVRAAERRLAAATADVGLALGEQFPRLVISGTGGFQALDAGDLLDAGSQVLGVSPLISWRIFDGGRVEAEIRVAEARQQRAVVAYEQAVLAALGDAERALSDYRHALRLRESLARAEAAASAALMATQTRVDAGDLGLLPLLDAERQLWDTRARQAQAEQQAAIGLVVACKALGGGWPADPDDAA